MTQERQLLTRKEVADRFEMSTKWIIKHEDRLGLRAAKVDLGGRSVRYRRAAVESILARYGILPYPPGIMGPTKSLQGTLG